MAKKQPKSATKATEAKPASTKEILAKARKAPVDAKAKLAAKPQTKAAANKKPANGKSIPTKAPSSEESSSESSSEEEEIPKAVLVKAHPKSPSSSSDSGDEDAAKTTTSVKPPAKSAPTAPMLGKTAITSKEHSDDDSDLSAGVAAKSVPPKAVQLKPALKKGEDISNPKKRAAAPSKNKPAPAKVAPSTKKEASLKSSESSDSDAATTVAVSSKNIAAKKISSSSEASDSSDSESNSDSDESDGLSTKQINGTVAKTAESSDSSDASDSESDQPSKAAKAAPAKAQKVESSSGSSDSDSSSSDEEDEKPVAKRPSSSDSSSGDSDSSEDEDGDAKMTDVPAKSAPNLATSAGMKRKAEDEVNSPAKKTKFLGGTTQSENDQQTTIFVGRLSWSVDNDRLAQEFAECGEVESATVQMDRDSGRSRGFGYVRFKAADAVEKALAMNGKEIDGRAVNIDRGTAPDRNKGREQRAKTFGDQISPPSSVLFVGNISFSTTEDGLWSFFNEYGVKSVRLPTDRDTGRPKGYGYVEFEDVNGAKKAFEASQGAEIDGRSLRLDYSQPRDGPGGGRGGGRGFGRGSGRGGFDRGGRGGRGGGDRGRGGGDRAGRGGRGRGGARRGGIPAFEGKKTTF